MAASDGPEWLVPLREALRSLPPCVFVKSEPEPLAWAHRPPCFRGRRPSPGPQYPIGARAKRLVYLI